MLSDRFTLKEMRNDRDYGEQQQNVDQRAGYVKHQKATEPQEKKHYKQNQEH
jgi:hypothetical protein